jgi:hypothetical protein
MADLAFAGVRTAMMYQILDQTAKALLPPSDEIDTHRVDRISS